jgi:hypothetical protein
MRILVPVLLILGLFAGLDVLAAEPTNLDPTLPYQAVKSNPVTYDVDFSAVVVRLLSAG